MELVLGFILFQPKNIIALSVIKSIIYLLRHFSFILSFCQNNYALLELKTKEMCMLKKFLSQILLNVFVFITKVNEGVIWAV